MPATAYCSVVIPLYNKAPHIRRAIDSVLAQKYQDFELIVVDDGSTDGGVEVVRRYTDRRIRVVIQERGGVSAARNRGIREAKCDLVAFLDADDEWLPLFLDTVMGLRIRYPEAGMYATAYRCSQGSSSLRPAFIACPDSPEGGLLQDYFFAALGEQPVHSSAVMIPKHVLEEVGGFPVGLARGEDLQVWGLIALRYRVAWSPVAGEVYHMSASNRACLLLPVDLEPGAVCTAPIEEFLQSGRETVSPRHNVAEYCISMRLNYAMACYLEGKRAWGVYNLDKTGHTTMFRKKRLFLRILFLFPPGVVKIGMKLKRGISRHVPGGFDG